MTLWKTPRHVTWMSTHTHTHSEAGSVSDICVFLLNMYIMYETVESMGGLEQSVQERERERERRGRERKRAKESAKERKRERR